VRTGAATQLPAFQPVATHDVRVEGDSLQVGVEHR
jgi:nitrite reductase/ring-hydroxylating ferredoxin subunit